MDISFQTDTPIYSSEDEITFVTVPYALYMKIMNFTLLFSIAGYSIIFIVGIIGNGLVIWITGFKIKTISAVWFLNLAIADFIFQISLLIQISDFFKDDYWPFSPTLCKSSITTTILSLNMFASIYFLTIISIDRSVSIIWPLKAKIYRTPRLALIIAIFIWVLSVLSSLPNLLFFMNFTCECYPNYYTFPLDNNSFVGIYWEYTNIYPLIPGFVSTFVIPFGIFGFAYGVIVFKLCNRKKYSKLQRPFKIVTAVVVCFFSCWLPYQLWPLITIKMTARQWITNEVLRTIFVCLAYSNSCINPILYVLLGQDFKHIFRKPIPTAQDIQLMKG